jgi:glyoxylase-like metal-dependent hydrolase (beta-lactamase superfamily II)
VSTFTIGAAKITRIEETYEPNFDATWFFPDWQPDVVERHREWMLPNHYDPASGKLKLSVHSWFVQVGGRNILIDTCVGNDKERPYPFWHRLKTPYLDRLAQAGAKSEDVNLVMCTHLHSDHVGWNTRLDNGRWVPTFPNARYLFTRADVEYYKAVDPQKLPGPAAAYKDSVAPILEAGLADLVSGLHTVDEHLTLEPAPGHTPGTMFITLASHGARAVFCGDILHQAIQIFHPEWNSLGCQDSVNARRSRRLVLEKCAGSGALLMPTHFGAPFVCHVDAKGDTFVPRWA